jgi:ribose-phosphate pyrophosphokinase
LSVNYGGLGAQGAADVRAFATHALFSPHSLDGLVRSELSEIVVTDTVALAGSALPPKLKVLTVADLLADTIRNVFADRSVSALFAGENELF